MTARSEQGGALMIVMAVIAALGIIGTISARQLMVHHRLAADLHREAVLRNLAEAGITRALARARRGLAPAGQALKNEKVGKYVASVNVAATRAADSAWLLTSTATVRSPAAADARLEIKARVRPGTGQKLQIISWEETGEP